VATEREGDGHGRVDVRTREVSGRVDHRHDHEAEGEGDAERPERAVVSRVGNDRAAAGEHQREGREALGGGPPS
jgi:hypothetical protein